MNILRASRIGEQSMAGLRAAWRLAGVAWSANRRTCMVVLGGSLASSVIMSLSGLWGKIIIDSAVHKDLLMGFVAVGLIAGSMTVGALLSSLSGQVVPEMADRMYIELQERVLSMVSEPSGIGHLESKEYMDHLEVLRTLGPSDLNGLVGTLSGALSLIAGLVVAIVLLASVYAPLPALLLLAVVPVLMARKVTRVTANGVESSAPLLRVERHLHHALLDVAPAREVRVYGAEDAVAEMASAAGRRCGMVTFWAQLKAGGLELVAWLPTGLAYGVAIAVAAVLAAERKVSLGDVVMAISVSGTLQSQLGSLAGAAMGFARAAVFVERFDWIEKHSQADPARTGTAPQVLRGGIHLQNVSFRYPGAATDALSEVDLHIPAGSVLALVGDNGAGKTTLVKLLCGFYTQTEGRITLDGVPLDGIEVGAWRDRVSAVFQDYVNYRFVLRENVGVGWLDAIEDRSAVRRALESANAGDVADGLPEGMETQLGRGWVGTGAELSGGQWQKLAVARMHMRSGPLLLALDEPTGALDAETEAALFAQYAGAARLGARRTGTITVLVSHRFSTVKMADHIAVVERGRIVEQGTHDALIALGGSYAEIYALHAQAYA